jgi:ABC-type Na+ transport system ATPase subunit NatA
MVNEDQYCNDSWNIVTWVLPVAANLSDILYSADQQCIVGLLGKNGEGKSY